MILRRAALAAVAGAAVFAFPANAADPIACVWVSGAPKCVYEPMAAIYVEPCRVNVGYCEPGANCKVNVGYCSSSGNCVVNVGYCDGTDLPVGV